MTFAIGSNRMAMLVFLHYRQIQDDGIRMIVCDEEIDDCNHCNYVRD